MRRVTRPALPTAAQAYLNKRQSKANADLAAGTLNVELAWKTARQTKAMGTVLGSLRQMMGPRERCMYCVDSHGCDIEHFRPKAKYPKMAFQWPNLLLCCTACGRLKGSQFPKIRQQALLINPANEDPWLHLDFDPATGNITARFDLQTNDWSVKGSKTVEVLQFDRREALSVVYLTTFRRLSRIVHTSIAAVVVDVVALKADLLEADDHGLLPWCFGPIGATTEPFSTLRHQHPATWADCQQSLS
jgi:uncharacterized protein (TIGR02646 family)